MLVSSSKDTTLKIWDLRTGKLKMDLPGHKDEVERRCPRAEPDRVPHTHSFRHLGLERIEIWAGRCDPARPHGAQDIGLFQLADVRRGQVDLVRHRLASSPLSLS